MFGILKSSFNSASTYIQSLRTSESTIVKTKIDDAVRCSLLAKKLKHIPILLQSLINEVQSRNGAQFYVNYKWKDRDLTNTKLGIKMGYAGIHVTILMPLKEQDKPDRHILKEVQIHHEAIMDEMNNCAKELAHRMYKPEGGEPPTKTEEGCSRLLFLAAMAERLAQEPQQEAEEKQLG